MLSDIIFTLPDGRDAIVRLDSTLDKNEIRVGSLGALDQFMADSSGRKVHRAPAGRTKIVRLSQQNILDAREWLDKNMATLSKDHKAVMTFFFPPSGTGMRTSKDLEEHGDLLAMTPNKARAIRNSLLRKAGILS